MEVSVWAYKIYAFAKDVTFKTFTYLVRDLRAADYFLNKSMKQCLLQQASDGGTTLLLNSCSSTTLQNTAGVKTWKGSIKATTSCTYVFMFFLLSLDMLHFPSDLVSSSSVGLLWTSKRKSGTRSVMTLNAGTSGPQVSYDPESCHCDFFFYTNNSRAHDLSVG